MDSMMFILGYLAVMFMGLVLGILGGGGSILTLPIFVYLFGLSALSATTHSLFVVGIVSLIGSVSYARQRLVHWQAAGAFVVPAVLGIFFSRRVLLPALPSVLRMGPIAIEKNSLVLLAFALLMVAASYSMLFKKRLPTNALQAGDTDFSMIRVAMQGLFVGTVTGFVGAGGGFLIVPALVVIVGLEMRSAVGTSLIIIASNSLLGFFGDLASGQSILWGLLVRTSVIAGFGILIGSRVGRKFPEVLLKKIFGVFVLLMGSVILLQQILKS